MVLLVLAIIWGVVLFSWYRSRKQDGFSDSVGTFRKHLTVLERAAPSTVVPANRRRGPSMGQMPPHYRVDPLGKRRRSPASRAPQVAHLSAVGASAVGASAARRRSSPASVKASRRRQSQKRRRDVFFSLLAAAGFSAVVALISRSTPVVYLQLLIDALLACYVGLLVRMRNLVAERELKLTFLPVRRQGATGEATNVQQLVYKPGSSYADLRQVAN